MIKAVFFDMGGTIDTYTFTPELRLNATPGIDRLLKQAGINLGLTNEQLFEVVTRGLKEYHRVCVQTQEELPSLKVWNSFVFKDFEIDPAKLAPISEELMLFIETRYYDRKMRPEVPEVLDTLRKMGLRIGIISNVNSKSQVPLNLAQYGIKAFFDPIVLSSEYGRRKPDPSIFHYAARLAHVPTSECAFVGDQIERDVVGARKAGYGLVVQIEHQNPNERDVIMDAEPDALIGDLKQMIDLIKQANERPGTMNHALVKAVLFDAGDILYHRPERGLKFKKFLDSLTTSKAEDFDRQKADLLYQVYRGGISQEQYRDSLLKLYGITDPNILAQGKAVLAEEDNSVTFFDGVQETLLALKDAGFKLGIVTDTANPIHTKLEWFEKGGFVHVWDSIISSSEIGTRKPDPIMYNAALQQLDLRPEQVVFVGHKASELQGAREVGIHTIAFNQDSQAVAEYSIENFSDLLTVPLLKV